MTTFEDNSSKSKPYTAADYPEVSEWREKNFGYLNRTNITEETDYKSYDSEVLEQLGNQGDLLALKVLSTRLMKSGQTGVMKEVERLSYLSAVHGSTSVLGNLGIISSSRIKNPKARAIEQLAFYQAAIYRGDKQYIINANALLSSRKFSLTTAEKNKFKNQAKKYTGSSKHSVIVTGWLLSKTLYVPCCPALRCHAYDRRVFQLC